jgi:tRNA threonylcarbamoyladenosine biosynthesis protein TsaE
MKYLEIITENAQQTQKVGEVLAEEILRNRSQNQKALVIGLEGDLGSGKTTFIQGLARGFKIKEKITSPTFVIMKRYSFKGCGSWAPKKNNWLYHIDCYRISKPKDLIDLDFKEILSQSQNIIVVEWAERVKKILPLDILWIKFEYLDKDKRRIIIK